MAGTLLTYAGVEFKNALTIDCVQTVRKDDTNVDKMFDDFEIEVESILHLQQLTILGIGPHSGQDIAAAEVEIRNKLMEPRQTLWYEIDGKRILDGIGPYPRPGAGGLTGSAGAGGKVDLDNGPWPIHFKFTPIGTTTARCRFRVKCSIANVSGGNGVLHNAWSMRDAIDEHGYSTRTLQGRLRLASPNASFLGPHGFRGVVIPPLQTGFKRDLIDCTATTDGMHLDYLVVDKQTSNAAPAPATKWKLEHSISSSAGKDAKGTIVSIRVTLWGGEGTARTALIALAGQVWRERMGGLIGTPNFEPITQGVVIVDRIADNNEMIVEYQQSAMVPALLWDGGLGLVDASRIGQDLSLQGYNRLQNRVPSNFGTASSAGLWVRYLQSPSQGIHDIQAATLAQGVNNSNAVPGIVSTFTAPSLPQIVSAQPLQYSQGHQEGMYTTYELDSRFEFDNGQIALPFARASNASAGLRTQAVIPLFKPTCNLIVRVDAERVGKPPELPVPANFEHGGITYHFMKAVMVFSAQRRVIDGKRDAYASAVEYHFAMSHPFQPGNKIPVGALPWMRFDGPAELDSSTLFKRGIMGDPGTGAAPGVGGPAS